jgi:hypothetical protein
MSEKILKMKTTELPVQLELEASNGHIKHLTILPSKTGGAFINDPNSFCKKIRRTK